MTAYSLSKSRFFEGVWEGVIAGDTDESPTPHIEVRVHDKTISGVTLDPLPDPGSWLLKVPVPTNLLADGVHTFMISESELGQALGSFSIIAGDAAGEDIRAEMSLLRAELDMLKRSFRRHCRETA
ncbi:hypothetical protein [Marivita sp. XM-24bin2]|jgi:hypothetical protein|uniref:hypothetical protein n=1 Tax=unclassified Marivita TaxID=2632480 RepID=UPI000D7AAEF5|nr:hypothetical protein [Marivita sp. XM-24bin2]MCR9110620.1 hypothetical protein [Paracoccaceae bacterium]PWL37018.1 MAG: hypothetical protein DCO97_00375 [Marivita sp. XM-24bin2]